MFWEKSTVRVSVPLLFPKGWFHVSVLEPGWGGLQYGDVEPAAESLDIRLSQSKDPVLSEVEGSDLPSSSLQFLGSSVSSLLLHNLHILHILHILPLRFPSSPVSKLQSPVSKLQTPVPKSPSIPLIIHHPLLPLPH